MNTGRGVRILERFQPPLPIGSVKTVYDARASVYDRLSSPDIALIEENWKSYATAANNGGLFNYDSHTVRSGRLVVSGSHVDYKAHRAAADARERGLALSFEARKLISPVVASAIVVSRDQRVATRKRTESFANGKYDCSASGICVVKDGILDPAKTLLESMQRELGVGIEDVEDIAVTGLSESNDYSVHLITHNVRILTESQSVRGPNSDIVWVDLNRLPNFICEKYPEVLDDFVGASILGLPGRQGEVLAERLREDNVDGTVVGI